MTFTKIAILPDKLEGEMAELQLAWALISKTLPPRVVHLLTAHPVEQTQEMCDTLQDALLDTVRQLLGQPTITADQLHLAKRPVTAGGLGLPHLPTLILRSLREHHALPPCPGQRTQIPSDTPLSDKRETFCWIASEAAVKNTQHRWQVTSWTHRVALAYATSVANSPNPFTPKR